jgi:hypothetical protein
MKREVICNKCNGIGCEECKDMGFVFKEFHIHWNQGKITKKDTKLKIRRTHIKKRIGFVKNSKPISQYDLKGKLLVTWNNANEAEKCLSIGGNNQFSKRFYRQVISRCARGERQTAYGFKWKYANN